MSGRKGKAQQPPNKKNIFQFTLKPRRRILDSSSEESSPDEHSSPVNAAKPGKVTLPPSKENEPSRPWSIVEAIRLQDLESNYQPSSSPGLPTIEVKQADPDPNARTLDSSEIIKKSQADSTRNRLSRGRQMQMLPIPKPVTPDPPRRPFNPAPTKDKSSTYSYQFQPLDASSDSDDEPPIKKVIAPVTAKLSHQRAESNPIPGNITSQSSSTSNMTVVTTQTFLPLPTPAPKKETTRRPIFTVNSSIIGRKSETVSSSPRPSQVSSRNTPGDAITPALHRNPATGANVGIKIPQNSSQLTTKSKETKEKHNEIRSITTANSSGKERQIHVSSSPDTFQASMGEHNKIVSPSKRTSGVNAGANNLRDLPPKPKEVNIYSVCDHPQQKVKGTPLGKPAQQQPQVEQQQQKKEEQNALMQPSEETNIDLTTKGNETADREQELTYPSQSSTRRYHSAERIIGLNLIKPESTPPHQQNLSVPTTVEGMQQDEPDSIVNSKPQPQFGDTESSLMSSPYRNRYPKENHHPFYK